MKAKRHLGKKNDPVSITTYGYLPIPSGSAMSFPVNFSDQYRVPTGAPMEDEGATMTTATKIMKMPALQAALDKESFEWLAANAPNILDALEVEVARGVKPDAVHLYVLGEYERPELAQRLRQAARHLQRQG